jgi:hypothetical protein
MLAIPAQINTPIPAASDSHRGGIHPAVSNFPRVPIMVTTPIILDTLLITMSGHP